MSLEQGERIPGPDFMERIYRPNLRCLTTWMSVGADTEHGKYAMLGARVGCWQTAVKGLDLTTVRDLEHIASIYRDMEGNVDELIETYGNSLRQRLGIPIADYNEEDSRFFKFCQPVWRNLGVQDREEKSL